MSRAGPVANSGIDHTTDENRALFLGFMNLRKIETDRQQLIGRFSVRSVCPLESRVEEGLVS
jgi:hypothetical protein